ncbi:MAG: biotin-dependent carboxyltransferase family protein [Actinomycetia bacterium]|nr:biotin-dependent carboxyltransferase family protein [Actinomycetes bacterium]
MITVRSWGIAGGLVDAGRLGQMWLGKSRGGAVDLDSLTLGNRIVGNASTAPAYESSGGLTLEFCESTAIAVTGAVADIVVSGGPPVGWGSVAVMSAGAIVRVGRLLDGARVYVAVRDPAAPRQPITEPVPRPAAITTVGVWPGPRCDWFDEQAWATLYSSAYTVADTNRVGVRMTGAMLERPHLGELPSEGLVEGAVQVPPDGQPIIMLADHPTTGGYPVIAVVDPADIHHVAQAAVGSELRFTARR